MYFLIDRILELIKEGGITAKKLTSDLNLTNSAITEWKKGRAKPGTDAVIKIARYFNVSADWLLTGQDFGADAGDRITLTADETALIYDYRGLNADGKEYVRQTVRIALNTYKKLDRAAVVAASEPQKTG